MTGLLIERGSLDRHTERKPCEETGERWPSASPGKFSEETDTADTLVLDFQPLTVRKYIFCCLSHLPCLWYFVMTDLAN